MLKKNKEYKDKKNWMKNQMKELEELLEESEENSICGNI